MTQNELKQRTKKFALRIIRLTDAIPNTNSGNAIARQIVKSGTSVGANYRAACRSKSDRDFLNKMIIVEEEADETAFWLELLQESSLMTSALIEPLWKEADEMTAIFTAAGRTIRERIRNSPTNPTNPKSEIRNPESE